MAKKTINLGTPPSGVGGDTARAAFEKCNDNFDELYDHAQQGVDALSAHAGNTDNPHGVDKEQVGLGKVENYPIASVEQAKSGSGDAFMTPALVHEAFKQYGLGVVVPEHPDWNDASGGTNFIRSNLNSPPGMNYAGGLSATGGRLQIAGRYGRAAIRDLDHSEQWVELYTRGNVLGTVSQSGGIPSGAIIERGSNANGDYVRFADGTQICWFGLVSVPAAGLTWAFPALFFGLAAVFASADTTTIEPRLLLKGGVTAGSASIRAVNAATGSAMATGASLYAVGRWH